MFKQWAALIAGNERLNFLLTNRLPRRWATLAMGRLSRVTHPLVRRPALAVWRLFGGDFRLHEAKETRFDSLHALFTRELKHGARPIAPGDEVIVSPCDALVGAHGRIVEDRLHQIKGFPY